MDIRKMHICLSQAVFTKREGCSAIEHWNKLTSQVSNELILKEKKVTKKVIKRF